MDFVIIATGDSEMAMLVLDNVMRSTIYVLIVIEIRDDTYVLYENRKLFLCLAALS